MHLSPHFTLEELTRSETAIAHRINNDPSIEQVDNLVRLCEIALEPVRVYAGWPLHINSGYRCEALNALVWGQPTSAHLDGRAADFIVRWGTGVHPTIEEFWAILRDSNLPYDQLIIEHSNKTGATWIHFAIAREGEEPRREAFPLTKRENRATS